MDEMQQAHHELDRLQGIITRHEGHMFVLRGWMLTLVGGLLAASYTRNIAITEMTMRIGLPVIALLFLFVESRHENLVEAVAERAMKLEKSIADGRRSGTAGWYNSPRVSEVCANGARRWWPRAGMTFILYRPFYIVVLLIIIVTTIGLPKR